MTTTLDVQSYITSKLYIAAAEKPPIQDQAGYESLTYVEIGLVMNIPAMGDTHADIPIDTLSEGRVLHVIGSADGGAAELTHATLSGDPGQAALIAVNGSNIQNAFKIVDPEPTNETLYFCASVSSLKDTPRETGAYKGKTFTLDVNTPVLRINP